MTQQFLSFVDRLCHWTSGSPERRKTASRTARCNFTAAAQSVPMGWTGAPMVISTDPRRGKWCSGRRMARVPRMATGTTGTPASAARAHVEGPQPRRAGQTALGEDHQRLPGSDEGDDPVGVGHPVLTLMAFHELSAEPLEHEPD